MANITRARTGEFLRTLFKVLMAQPEGLSAATAIAMVRDTTPLTDFEAGAYPSGGQRFEKILRFATVDCVKAGCGWRPMTSWRTTLAGACRWCPSISSRPKTDFRAP